MTLCLLGTLRWDTGTTVPTPLPAVLPVAILLVLARHGEWISRAEVASLFWPDQLDPAALLNLRVNLLKARRILQALDICEPIQSERRRIRWSPATDVRAIAGACGCLAQGFDLPHFERFDRWLRDWRQHCAGPSSLRATARDTGDVEDDEAPTLPPAAPGFYGRHVELARMRAFNLPALVIAGEAGVGKSRLVAEALGVAPWLRGREGLRQIAFGAVADLFNNHAPWLQDLGAYRLDIARLLPDTAPDEPLPPLDAITARVRLFEGLARAVERHGVLLAVDDLQWADAATVEWLVMLAHRGQLRWVATARGDELPARTADALRSLEAAGAASVITLQGLDRTALNALLHDRRPDLAGPQGFPRPHSWLDALWAYTAGNAFCALELMEALTPDDAPQRMAQVALPERVACMLRGRRDRLPAPARAVVDAAGVAIGHPSIAQLAAVAGLDIEQAVAAVECAQQHGLMRDTVCRHDLVREALRAGMTPTRAAELHRRTARHLVAEGAEPETIAFHWRHAGDDEAAWPFVLRAAQRLRERGEHDAAMAALSELRDATNDEPLALRAEIMLAQEHLFDDLVAGRRALESARVRASRLPPGMSRQTLEAHVLAGLVDNAVFSGDLGRASALARALRERLPGLARDVLVEAHPVLIEAAMREGDFEAAVASLEGLRQAGAAHAVVLSFEAQIHWFSGAVREARRVFEHLLARHPDYCHGLTIENDLAVMCHALGDLGAAEEMARRSLRSWTGVAHTEALSSLVLGSTLASGGRFAEALEALDRAHELGLRQGSALFVSEALARRARLHWTAGRHRRRPTGHTRGASAGRQGGRALARERPGAPGSADGRRRRAAAETPMRWPCWGRCRPADTTRWCRFVTGAHRLRPQPGGRRRTRPGCRRQQAAVAQQAGLLEWLCEALALVGRFDVGAAADASRDQAQTLAHAQSFGWLADRIGPVSMIAR